MLLNFSTMVFHFCVVVLEEHSLVPFLSRFLGLIMFTLAMNRICTGNVDPEGKAWLDKDGSLCGAGHSASDLV